MFAKSHYKQSLIDRFVRSKDPKLYQYIKSITKSNSLPSVLKYNLTTVDTDLDKGSLAPKRGVRISKSLDII